MRILILGAGAVGGYFGARIHESGGDVTFLVRPERASRLQANGLRITSPLGDLHIAPRLLVPAQVGAAGTFDAIVLACKAYDLEAAIAGVAPAVGAQSLVVPLLNGLVHLDRLDARFGRERVLGGLAHLGVVLTPEGEIRHLNELDRLVIGCRSEPIPPVADALATVLTRTGIDFVLSENIEADLWGKFVFLSTLAGATCTMRSSVGGILRTQAGESFILGLFDECLSIAARHGHILSPERIASYRSQLTARDSTSTASMLRDVERGARTEADHILGDMVRRADAVGIDAALLKLAYSHLQAYEARRSCVQSHPGA